MDEIQSIADYCSENHGAKAAIRKAFEKLSGRPARRENFDRWLHADPSKRTCPIMRNGVLLLKAAKLVMESREKNR